MYFNKKENLLMKLSSLRNTKIILDKNNFKYSNKSNQLIHLHIKIAKLMKRTKEISIFNTMLRIIAPSTQNINENNSSCKFHSQISNINMILK